MIVVLNHRGERLYCLQSRRGRRIKGAGRRAEGEGGASGSMFTRPSLPAHGSVYHQVHRSELAGQGMQGHKG